LPLVLITWKIIPDVSPQVYLGIIPKGIPRGGIPLNMKLKRPERLVPLRMEFDFPGKKYSNGRLPVCK